MSRLFYSLAAAAALAAAGLLAIEAPAGAQVRRVEVFRTYSKAELFDLGASFVSQLPYEQQPFVRLVDYAGVGAAGRPLRIQVTGGLINSLSGSDVIAEVTPVPGTQNTLAYFDLRDIKVSPAEFDRLCEEGSGPSAFPEPYYHLIDDTEVAAREVEYQEDYDEPYEYLATRYDGYGRPYAVRQTGYRKATRTRHRQVAARKVRKVALSPHLNKATAIGLSTITRTKFPIVTYHWLAYNALVEPAYHRLLNLGDSLDDYKKLAQLVENRGSRFTPDVRGVVLFSEVTNHSRALLRKPTQARKGGGSFQISLDFKTSVRKQDVMKDLDNRKADAFEVIFNLPAGMPAYGVFNDKEIRLDKADGDIALATTRRTIFKDNQVRQAYVCMDCHMKEAGWIPVDDEVRFLRDAGDAKLLLDNFDKRRADRIRQQYLDDDGEYNDLLKRDRDVVVRAVRLSTKGLTPRQFGKTLSADIAWYLQEPVSLDQLAMELGATADDTADALTTKGLDPVFKLLAKGRKVRRDTVESGFAQVATVLYKKGAYGK